MGSGAGVDEQSLLQAMLEGNWDEWFPDVPADWRAKSLRKVLRPQVIAKGGKHPPPGVHIGCNYAGAGLRPILTQARCNLGQAKNYRAKFNLGQV